MNDQELSDYCNEYFIYNSHTGIFTRKIRIGNQAAESEIGFWHRGYKRVCINYKKYYCHRLAFLICKGYMPKFVDHKDTIKHHNWIDNLRDSTKAQNSWNRPQKINNTSGFKGVSYVKSRNNWQVNMTVNHEHIHIGYFICPIEAAKAYNAAALKYHGEFAWLNPIP